MRCDLHVHSWFSGGAGVPVLDHLGRECYSDPLEVYERSRLRGMDLVTLTDHDTVEGAMRLAHLPECFLSEELTVHLEGGRQLHVNAFGSPSRSTRSCRAPARPRRLFAYSPSSASRAVNHLFSALTGARELADLRLPLDGSRHRGAQRRCPRRTTKALARSARRAHGPVGAATPTVGTARASPRLTARRSRSSSRPAGRLCVPAGRSQLRPAHERGHRISSPATPRPGSRRGAAHPPGWPRAPCLMPLCRSSRFTLAIHAHEPRSAGRHFRAPGGVGWPAQTRRRPALGAPPLEEVA